MAKVGEGDPRWVVQSREDGKNVNNWHWSETDCLGWSNKYLTTLLSHLTIFDDDEGQCNTGKVSSLTGECTANVRKGKTIFYYEMELKFPWEGQLKGSETKVKGQFTLPYISEECDDDKMEVKVSCDSEDGESGRLVTLVQRKGVPFIQNKIAEFLKALRAEYTVKSTPQQPSEPTLPSFEQKPPPPQEQPKKTTTSKPSKPGTRTIKITEEFRAPAREIYNSMIDPQMLNAIMQGSATMNPTEGGAFTLLGGAISGQNVKLVPGKTIVQKWRFNTWPEGHYSTVNIELKEEDGETTLHLVQEGVPSDDTERTEEGWRRNIWGRAKMMFGFGPVPF